MRTNIDIDDDLKRQAMRSSGEDKAPGGGRGSPALIRTRRQRSIRLPPNKKGTLERVPYEIVKCPRVRLTTSAKATMVKKADTTAAFRLKAEATAYRGPYV